MKYQILFTFFLSIQVLYSQNCSYKEEILKLENKLKEVGQDAAYNNAANVAQIQEKIMEYNNACQAEINEKRAKALNEIENKEIYKRNQEEIRRQNDVKEYQRANSSQKIANYNSLANELSNGLNEISNSLNTIANNRMMAMLNKELDRRSKVENKFFNDLRNKFEMIDVWMNKIKNENLYKSLKDGYYYASFLERKQFSFSKNNEILYEEKCIVYIENDNVKELYIKGFKNLKSSLPSKYAKQCKVVEGVVKFQDFETLKQYTILIFEPFVNPDYQEAIIEDGKIGEICFWTSNKKDEGKPIFVQELDKDGYIKREVETKLIYAKNEKEALTIVDDYKVKVESGVKLLFFTQPMTSYIGFYPMYPRVSKSDLENLKQDEFRIIKVKDYMEP